MMMMGCAVSSFFGVLGVVALAKWLMFGAHRRFHRLGRCGGAYYGDAWGEGDEFEGRRRHRGHGRRARRGGRKLGWLFHALDTSPEQEQVLLETAGDLSASASKIAGKVAASRSQWADALEAEGFDETMVGGAVAELENSVEEARKTAIDAFARLHATLDAEQRRKLAGWLRRRGGRFGGPFRGGPYRTVL